MSEQLSPRRRTLHINADTSEGKRVLKALASGPRLRVLDLLSDHVYNVSEIAEALGMPLSTATLHIQALEDAELVTSELQPAVRGQQKICARSYDTILVELARGKVPAEEIVEFAMPIGAYVDCQVTPTCGLASEHGIIGLFDDPTSFYEPDRVNAQLIWFHHGYVEYRFPNRLPAKGQPDSLSLSFEVCSEAPLHHEDWPSDITVWINNVEVGTWTSPGDFGGQQGILTPEWWESWNSQYGLLKVWQVGEGGSFVDGVRISDICLRDLQIPGSASVSVRIGVKADAHRTGGVNIFGRRFGNYPQDIVLRFRYH